MTLQIGVFSQIMFEAKNTTHHQNDTNETGDFEVTENFCMELEILSGLVKNLSTFFTQAIDKKAYKIMQFLFV